jgi:hypothetical protein
MNRTLLIILGLISIFFIYKQRKKQTRIIDDLNNRITYLEEKQLLLERKKKNKNVSFSNENETTESNINSQNKDDSNLNDSNLNDSNLNDSNLNDSNLNDSNLNENNLNESIQYNNLQTCYINGLNCNQEQISINENSINNTEKLIHERLNKFCEMETGLNIIGSIEPMTASVIINTSNLESQPSIQNSNNIVELESINSNSDTELTTENCDFNNTESERLTSFLNNCSDTFTSTDELSINNYSQLNNNEELNNDNFIEMRVDSIHNVSVNKMFDELTSQNNINNIVNNLSEQNNNLNQNLVEELNFQEEEEEIVQEDVVQEDIVQDNLVQVELVQEDVVQYKLEIDYVTKKFATENKNECCAIKKLGSSVGKIHKSLNVPAVDYLFVKCNNKDLLNNILNTINFPENIILNKSNLNKLINI